MPRPPDTAQIPPCGADFSCRGRLCYARDLVDRWWNVTLGCGVVARCLAGLVVLSAACDGDAPPPPPTAVRPGAPEPGVLRLAGTGAMTPLIARLSAAFAACGPAHAAHPRCGCPPAAAAPRVVVEDSIGSAGGVRAASDGAVDLGLISRPLRPAERLLGLVHVPVGWDAVVLAAHPGVSVGSLSMPQIYDLYAGRRREFPDGSPAVVLLRDRGESANNAFEATWPALEQARESAYRTHRLRVLYHDSAMAEALVSTPGAIGVFSLGAVLTYGLPLKVLSLPGVQPSLSSLRDGTWPARRALGFVVRPDRLARARPFLDFVASAEAAELAAAGGYWLEPGRAP